MGVYFLDNKDIQWGQFGASGENHGVYLGHVRSKDIEGGYYGYRGGHFRGP